MSRHRPDNSEDWSLFDTPESKVIKRLDDHTKRIFETLLREPLEPLRQLSDAIAAYVNYLTTVDQEFVDLETARRVSSQCRALLAKINPDTEEDERRLIQAAVRYFIVGDDAERDLRSPIGFDDDAEVVEAVAYVLGYHDVLNVRSDEEG